MYNTYNSLLPHRADSVVVRTARMTLPRCTDDDVAVGTARQADTMMMLPRHRRAMSIMVKLMETSDAVHSMQWLCMCSVDRVVAFNELDNKG